MGRAGEVLPSSGTLQQQFFVGVLVDEIRQLHRQHVELLDDGGVEVRGARGGVRGARGGVRGARGGVRGAREVEVRGAREVGLERRG